MHFSSYCIALRPQRSWQNASRLLQARLAAATLFRQQSRVATVEAPATWHVYFCIRKLQVITTLEGAFLGILEQAHQPPEVARSVAAAAAAADGASH